MDDVVVTPLDDQSPPTHAREVSGDIPEYLDLKDMLDMRHPSMEDERMMGEVWGYFKGENDERKLQIKQLENRLGAPMGGQSRLHRLYEYVKTSKEIDTLDKYRNSI